MTSEQYQQGMELAVKKYNEFLAKKLLEKLSAGDGEVIDTNVTASVLNEIRVSGRHGPRVCLN